MKKRRVIDGICLSLIVTLILGLAGVPVWAGLEDQHDVSAIVKALKSSIPPDTLAQAQQYDDALMKNRELNGAKIYLVTDDRAKRVNVLVGKVLAAMNENDHQWVVRVLQTETPVVNAFVVGGKYIYVFGGLLDKTQSDDELAFILSHEIGHSMLKHNLRRQDDLTNTLANLADLVTSVAAKKSRSAVSAVTEGIRASYSRTDEEEADAIGIAISWHAGFDPIRGVDFFSRLEKEDRLADEKLDRTVSEMQTRTQAEVGECNARVQAINQVRANRRDVIPQYANETQAICNQAQQSVANYNSMVSQYNLYKSNKNVAAMYDDHPSDQNRISAVAALTDYVNGRRSLESLRQFQQSYRVMSALKQTNSSLMMQVEKVAVPSSNSPALTVPSRSSGKTMSDQLQQLKQAFEQGLLTEEEYKSKRKQILDSF